MKHLYLLMLIFISVSFLPGADFLFAQKPQASRGIEITPDESEQFVTRNNMRINVKTGAPAAVYMLNYAVTPDSP